MKSLPGLLWKCMRPLRLPLRAFLFFNPKGDLQNRGETETTNYKEYAVQAFLQCSPLKA